MSEAPRTGRRVTLVARRPRTESAIIDEKPNYGVRRVMASLTAAGDRGDLESLEVTLFERGVATEPDVVGLSAYIWSFSALVTRGDPAFEIAFDPETVRLTACQGWTPEALAETEAWISEVCGHTGGTPGRDWWSIPRPDRRPAA